VAQAISTTESVRRTQRWLERVVVALDLCPFAKREFLNQRVRFKESAASTQEQLLQDLVVELALLNRRPDIETTLLIHPKVLQDFDAYNQFLDFADSVIMQMKLEGVFQIASFHPHYQFANTHVDDVQNFTNRSPCPLLHILREASLAGVIDRHSDIRKIPHDNIQLMRSLGAEYMQNLLASCSDCDDANQ